MSETINSLPVSEENYQKTMTQVVEPFLAERRRDAFFKSFDGHEIHYEQYLTPDAAGTVVISHGFTESAEKFREMSYCFILMGYNVFAIDHRGHGRSWRKQPEAFEIVTVDRFEEYVEDLRCLVEREIRPAVGNGPLYIYAHSMGGAVAVQFLQTYPGVFQKAVLSAPMIQARSGPVSPGLTLAMTRVFCAFGQRDKMVFIHHGFDPDRTYENSRDTSKARDGYCQAKRLKDDLLKTASASYSWVREAMKVAKKNLDPRRNAAVTVPVLLCQPEEDSSVVSEKENVFISQIPNGKLVRFTDCRHEIYASVDATVLEYLQAIEAFLKED